MSDGLYSIKPPDIGPNPDVPRQLAAGSVAQIMVAVIAILILCYLARLVMLTLLTSILLAFILSPVVDTFARWRLPRSVGAFVAVCFLLGWTYGLVYFSYNQAVSFTENLPRYSSEIRAVIRPFQKQAEEIQKTAETILPGATDNGAANGAQAMNITAWLTNSAATLTEIVLAVSFVPFLIYFILSWQEHMLEATVRLFRHRNQEQVRSVLREISAMLRGFIAGNFFCGLFMALMSAAMFGLLGVPYFHFVGVVSGFLSLVPYLGVVLATLPPVVAGLGVLNLADLAWVVATVVGLHVFTLNVLFPKVIGHRLNLNPVVVTIALLIWGWIWGGMGFILAIPITGALKITCDHIEPLRAFGQWLGE